METVPRAMRNMRKMYATTGLVLALSLDGRVKMVPSETSTLRNAEPANAIPAVRDRPLALKASSGKNRGGRTVEDPRRDGQLHPQMTLTTRDGVRQLFGQQDAPEEGDDEDEGAGEEEEQVEDEEEGGPAREGGGEEAHGGSGEGETEERRGKEGRGGKRREEDRPLVVRRVDGGREGEKRGRTSRSRSRLYDLSARLFTPSPCSVPRYSAVRVRSST